VDDLWAPKSEGIGLIVLAISFQDFQPGGFRTRFLRKKISTARWHAECVYASVCDVQVYRDQIGWNISKIISRPDSLRLMHCMADHNMGDLVQREDPQN